VSLKSDAWLSGILGMPAYHLSGAAFSPPGGQAFVDAKVAVGDAPASAALQAQGFRVVDTNLQFLRPAGVLAPGPAQVRLAQPTDEKGVRSLAATAFLFDRFHQDPAIGSLVASRLKEEWAGNYFAGKRGDRMVVAEDAAGLCGFLQLLRSPDGDTVIDLVAVSERSRGRGVARSMIALATRAPDTGAIRVGTQIANLPSLGLYQALGFRLNSAAYVLHLHL
jgi:ribosomal protein S18 acetylase RimI-like enzyme